MRKPTEYTDFVMSDSGRMKKATFYSYVATLCRKDGDEVMAVRFDGYANRVDLYPVIRSEYQDWNLKGVLKLYDDDFRREGW